MATNIKIVRDTTVLPDEGETLQDVGYVLRSSRAVKDDYVLLSTEEDFTNLYNLDIFYTALLLDSKARRSGLKYILGRDGWDKLDLDTQKAMARVFVGSAVNIGSIYPKVWDRVINGFESFHIPALESRAMRFNYCAALIYNAAPVDADNILNKIAAPMSATEGSLKDNYVFGGREGKYTGDALEGLLDFVNSNVGTSYVGNGLAEMISNDSFGILKKDIVSTINDCLLLGIYRKS